MAFNRSDIRTGVRDKLSAWPDLVTTITEPITTTTQATATLAAATSVTEAGLLEIGNEVLSVLSLSSLVATVNRGARGTTAATHLDNAVIKVYQKWGWTDAHLNRIINKAISWMGEGSVWTLVPKTNTFLLGFREFGLPSGANYPNGNHVKILEILQSDGSYKKTLAWKHIGDRLILPSELTEDLDVRFWLQQAQPTLSSDATNLDADKYLEVLELYTAGRCLEELVGNRSRYTEYSATLNDRASSLDELQRQAYFFSNQAVILRNEMSRPGLSGQASFHHA